MQLDFSKADRLMHLIYDSRRVLWASMYDGAYEMKNSTNKSFRTLYADLVKITSSNKTKEEKSNLRNLAFANVYQKMNDPVEGGHYLKCTFDEEATVKRIAKAYWQLQTNLTIDWNYTSDDNSRVTNLRAFVDTYFPNEPFKEVIVETTLLRDPKIQDLETEFWNNCPDLKSIDDLCNIYRERLKEEENLIQVDLDFYKFDKLCFDNNNLLNQYLKELRLCGLLEVSEAYVEARISHIAEEINKTSNGIVELFKRLRASSSPTNTRDNAPQVDESKLPVTAKDTIQERRDKGGQKTPKTLSGLITHNKSSEIVEGVKNQYKNIKGKRLKLLLLAFQDLDLLPKERIARSFHQCCETGFTWDIGSYNAMNKYVFNEHIDTTELESIKQYISKLING